MKERRRKGWQNLLRRRLYWASVVHVFIVSSTVIVLASLGKDDLLRTYGGILYGVPNSLFREPTTLPLVENEPRVEVSP